MVASQFTRRILSSKVLIASLIVVAFLLGLLVRGDGNEQRMEMTHVEAGHTEPGPQDETIWTCSMHPQIKLPKPGKCPICFMDLIPLEDNSETDLGPRTLSLSKAAVALAEIQTSPVERQTVTAEVRLLGKVNYDETRYRTISAWVPGRIDTLFVDYTGTAVSKGDRLVSLYSPELYATQAELFNALQGERELRNSDHEIIRQTATATVASSRERLRLWGLTSNQISTIERRGTPSYHLDIRSPLSGIVVHKNAVEGMYVQTGTRIYTVADLSHVWVTLDAYESDLIWLRVGQTIEFSVEAIPGRKFQGTIVFIDPILNEKTRTVMVRLDVDNSVGLLKPGMFVQATAVVPLDQGGRALSDKVTDEPPLIIPASAALITGKRAVVYVRLPNQEKPTFEGREIVLGPRAGDYYIVESGLQEGELVVAKGNFKLDSALQIQAKPSMMNPDGGGSVPGHDHGIPSGSTNGTPAKNDAAREHRGHEVSVQDKPMMQFTAPSAFQEQLGAVLAGYLEIQAALAGDDDRQSRDAVHKAARALQAVDMRLLEGEAHLAWMKDLGLLQKAISSVAGADDMAGRREAFRPLSESLWATLRHFGYHGHQTVRWFHCPMANSGAGANWIQIAETTANPYYGASMLLCGSQTDSISAAARAEGAR